MEIRGQAQVIENLSRYGQNVVRELVYGCEAVQANVINEARRIVPYDTGTLHGSIGPGGIHVSDDDIEAVVIAGASYASFVEFGTSRSRAQPYLFPALIANKETFRRAMIAAVKRARAA